MSKRKAKPEYKAEKRVKFQHEVGDKHFIDNMQCEVRHVNAGQAWLSPTHSDPDEPLVAPHIAYAVMNEYGEVKRIC